MRMNADANWARLWGRRCHPREESPHETIDPPSTNTDAGEQQQTENCKPAALAERRRCVVEDDLVSAGFHLDSTSADVGSIDGSHLSIDARLPPGVIGVAQKQPAPMWSHNHQPDPLLGVFAESDRRFDGLAGGGLSNIGLTGVGVNQDLASRVEPRVQEFELRRVEGRG